MELVNIMNLNSLSIEEHQSEISRFFDKNVFVFTIDIGHIVEFLSESEEIKKCFRQFCNKIFLNHTGSKEQTILLDFDKTPYVIVDASRTPIPYKGTAEDWLKDPVVLYTIVMKKGVSSYQTMVKQVIALDNKQVIENIRHGKITNELNVRPLIRMLLNILVTDSVSGYSYGNDNLLIKCDFRGKPYFANKVEEIDITFLTEDVYMKDVVAVIEGTKYLQFICNEITEHTSDYPFNITKIHSDGDVMTIFVGNDARILAWHKAKLEELERKKEYAELNGLPYG